MAEQAPDKLPAAPASAPSFLRRVDSVVRGIANGITFGYADIWAGNADAAVMGGKVEDRVAAQKAETQLRRSEGSEERIGEVVGAAGGFGKLTGAVGAVTGGTKLMAFGALAQAPMAAASATMRTTIGLGLRTLANTWAITRLGFKGAKAAATIGAGTFAASEGLSLAKDNWGMISDKPMPAWVAGTSRLADMAWGAEKGLAQGAWNNVITPGLALIGNTGKDKANPASGKDAVLSETPPYSNAAVRGPAPKVKTGRSASHDPGMYRAHEHRRDYHGHLRSHHAYNGPAGMSEGQKHVKGFGTAPLPARRPLGLDGRPLELHPGGFNPLKAAGDLLDNTLGRVLDAGAKVVGAAVGTAEGVAGGVATGVKNTLTGQPNAQSQRNFLQHSMGPGGLSSP